MAEKDRGDGPSLELPSFGLRRRRRDEAPAGDVPAAAEEPAAFEPEPAPVATEEAEPVAEAERPAKPARTRPRLRRPTPPSLGARSAAMVTGAVVGLLLVLLAWAALESCGLLRGTTSCQGAGVVVWLAILVVVILVGRYLLRWFSLPDPGSTSFLAVGLIAVVALMFLSNVLDSPWMALVLPALGAVSYALSHWVTTAFVEPAGPESHR